MSTTTETIALTATTSEFSAERCVRFAESCILIPDAAKLGGRRAISRPRGLRKSFALPGLWSSGGSSGSNEKYDDSTVEERGRRIRLVIPGSGSGTAEAPINLTPCLRRASDANGQPQAHPHHHHHHHHHHQSTSPSAYTPRRTRSSSLPASTIPLRTCCKACIPIVDAFLADPSIKENMTRGAKRLLKSDSTMPLGEKVTVDEVAKLRGESRRIDPNSQDDDDGASGSKEDNSDSEESELFPLPSPRNSPRSSPLPSPTQSLTNLTVLNTSSGGRTSPKKSSSPLSSSYVEAVHPEEPDKLPPMPSFSPSTQESPRVEAGLTRTRSGSTDSPAGLGLTRSRSSSTGMGSPKPRRTSLSSLGESISKTSASLFKGFSGSSGTFVST